MPIPATWGAEPGPAEVLFLWKRALLCQRPLCAALSAPPGPQPGGGAAPGAAGGRGPLWPRRPPRPPALPGPRCCPRAALHPRRGRGVGGRMGEGGRGVTLPEVPLSGSVGRHGNLAPSLRLSVRPSRSPREKLWGNGSSSGPRGAAAAHHHRWRCHPKCPRAGHPRRCPRRCAPSPVPVPASPRRAGRCRALTSGTPPGGAVGGMWGGGHGDGTMGTGTRRRVTTKAK